MATPECVAARARARDTTGTNGAVAITPPSMLQIVLPPVPFTRNIPQIQITWKVDSTGKVTDIEYAPPVPSSYTKQFGETLMRARFRPAMLDGCAVSGTHTSTMTIGPTVRR